MSMKKLGKKGGFNEGTLVAFACACNCNLCLCTSCNNWLDVTPQGQIEAENLYQTTRGCNSALGGIYYTFSGSNLYGQTLSYGLLDVFAQYWDFASTPDHM